MADTPLTLGMVPEQAIEVLNNHGNEGLGKPVAEAGIEPGAVTESRLANESVSARTIQAGVITEEHLGSDIKAKIEAGGAESTPDLRSYVIDGLDVFADDGLSVTIQLGRAYISEKIVKLTTAQALALDARMAALLYTQKNEDNSLTVGKVNAKYPNDMIDDNTIRFWIFNQITAGAHIPNSAVGISAIAVANDLVPSGGVTAVDGRCDYALKGDGSTGYLVSQNSNGFPTVTAEFELNILTTVNSISTNGVLVMIGAVANSQSVYLQNAASTGNLTIGNTATATDTGFTQTVGETYLYTLQRKDGKANIFVNGRPIFSMNSNFESLAAGLLYLLRYSGSYYSPNTVHFVELRNKCRTIIQLGDIANKLLLPCSYTAPQVSYPTISATDKATAYHEWKFDETTGNTVSDSAGTLNGMATGTTIIDSKIGLGKSRKFSSNSDKIDGGNFQFAGDCTILGIVNPNTIGSSSRNTPIFSNYNGTTNSNIIATSYNGNRKLSIYTTTNWYQSNTGVPINNDNFIAVVVKDANSATLYCNSPNPSEIISIPGWNTTSTNPLKIGYYDSSNYFTGSIDYLLYIPRALTQPEIAVIYNAFMKTVKKDIREILPTNAISRGFVRTDSSKIIEVNQEDYRYGIRLADRHNEKLFLGYEYFTDSMTLNWDNPFGTRKIKTYFTWAQDAQGTNEQDTQSAYYDGAAFHGINYGYGTSAVRIRVNTCSSGVSYFNNSWQTSGYIGCYAEVIEDVV